MDKKFKELRFDIVGMDCAGCASTIEKGVASLADVNSATLTFTSGVLKVEGTAPPERIISRVRELGYDVARPPGTLEGNVAADVAEDHERSRPAGAGGLPAYLWSRWSTRLALLAALLIIPGLLLDELLPGLGVESPVFALMSVLAMAVAGYPIALSALRALRINREITINLLMTIAAVGAVIIGAYVEAGLVMVLFALGEALEGYTANRARETIGSLTALAPAAATVIRNDREERRPVSELRVGDHLIVLPGERLAMDGVVVAGESAVNQAPITGESRLVDKLPGDPV
ncbi:MAG TPA: cation transporter, partial [Promineifilum sp.]